MHIHVLTTVHNHTGDQKHRHAVNAIQAGYTAANINYHKKTHFQCLHDYTV